MNDPLFPRSAWKATLASTPAHGHFDTIKGNSTRPIYNITDCAGIWIARVAGENEIEAAANAELVRAAPELLAAMRYLFARVDFDECLPDEIDEIRTLRRSLAALNTVVT